MNFRHCTIHYSQKPRKRRRIERSGEAAKPASRDELRDELLAVVRARQELSHDDDAYLVENFLSRLDQEIESRIESRIDAKHVRVPAKPDEFALGALGIAIPLSVVAAIFGGGLPGIIVVCAAVVLVVLIATVLPPFINR